VIHQAAVFIGGMDGVEAEQKLFTDWHSHVRQYPVGSTGGAARRLWEKFSGDENGALRHALREDMQYLSLFEDLLR